MEVNWLSVNKNKARKRATQPEKWKANIAKANRYKPKAMPEITCDHFNGRYKCKTLKMTDIKKFHEAFSKNSNKTYQDALLLKYYGMEWRSLRDLEYYNKVIDCEDDPPLRKKQLYMMKKTTTVVNRKWNHPILLYKFPCKKFCFFE